jgi:hypothetical protein
MKNRGEKVDGDGSGEKSSIEEACAVCCDWNCSVDPGWMMQPTGQSDFPPVTQA